MPNVVSAGSRGAAALPSAPLPPYFSIVISYVFWAAAAVCAVAQVFIIAGAVRTRAPDRADAAIPRSSRAVEIGWTLVPALGLALLLVFTHRAIDSATGQAPAVSVPPTGMPQ
jgi:heme/copper-type cytochrome/quinol oxidase subunit 2